MTIIVLVNYNGWKDTIECIDSLLKLENSNYKIVVVDNCSTDDSYEQITQSLIQNTEIHLYKILLEEDLNEISEIDYSSKFFLLKAKKNGGFAYGNNLAIKMLDRAQFEYRYVWILNNDTVIAPNSLNLFVDRMDADHYKRYGMLGGKLYFYDQPFILQGVGGVYNKWLAKSKHIGYRQKDIEQFNKELLIFDYVIGASMFVRKEFIKDIGLMREDYFLYFEELDWTMRGKAKGWEIGYEPRVKVYHKEGSSTTKKGYISKTADMCQVRNRLVFTYRFYPKFLIIVYPFVLYSVCSRLFKGRFRRAWIIFKIIIKTSKELLLGQIPK